LPARFQRPLVSLVAAAVLSATALPCFAAPPKHPKPSPTPLAAPDPKQLPKYEATADNALRGHHYARAIDYATRALTIDENVHMYFVRATAWASWLRYAQAIDDFEAAKALALRTRATPGVLDAIDVGLATSYIFGGQTDRGEQLAKAFKASHNGSTRIDDAIVTYYSQAAIAGMRQNKPEEAISYFERAAALVPARAPSLYIGACNIITQIPPIDWMRVKTEASKALAISPNDPYANFEEGLALARSGDANDAIPFLQTAQANAGSDTTLAGNAGELLRTLTGH